MSSSRNEASAPNPAPHLRLDAALNPRLAAALAASVALHAVLVAALGWSAAPRWGGFTGPGFAPPPIRVMLRAVAESAPPLAPVPAPAVVPALVPVPAPVPAPVPDAASRPDAPAAEAAQRSLLPGLHFYRTRDLDVQPGIMTQVEPEYPEAAARRFLSGKVVLRLYILESGAVQRVEVVRAEPPGVFERAAERAFLAARFTPGIKDRRAVRVRMTLEIAFDSAPPPEPPRR